MCSMFVHVQFREANKAFSLRCDRISLILFDDKETLLVVRTLVAIRR